MQSSPFLPFVPATSDASAIRKDVLHEIRQHLQIMMALRYLDKSTEAEVKKRIHRISALLISG